MIGKPFELNRMRLGMSLAGFKAKNRPAPRCDRDSSTGVVHCRPAASRSKRNGRTIPSVAAVPTEQLFYSFIDNRLFKITAVFEFAYTKDIRAALIGKYGEPDDEHAENWTWANEVSAIRLTQGNSRGRTTLTFVHHELNEMAECCEPAEARPQHRHLPG